MKHKILFGVVLAIAVLSAGLNVVQVIKNKNDIAAMKNPVGSVCGDNIINKYNNIKGKKEEYTKNAKALGNEISKKAGNEKDSNCVMMRLFIGTEDQEKTFKTLEEMVNKGQNPSLKINGASYIEYLKPSSLKYQDVGDLF
jgi:hypothetical protein